MPVALDRARYFGAHLSDNIAETPEGYRICRNAVIGRSGFQTYQVSELADPDGILGDDRRPDEEIEVWRDPSEVFSPATLSSFEGKTFTFRHPENLLDPDSEREHHAGHIQNVHKGTEPLESGDIPMLADIIVTERDAIRAIDSGERELSCGYSYKLAKTGYRYDQTNILGNHVALVPKGRAGAEARINDAAPAKETVSMNIFDKLFRRGFQLAKDAKSEDIAAATRALAVDDDYKEPVAVAKDSEMDDAARAAADKKKRMHDMLDKMISGEEEEAKKKSEQDDADYNELKSMLNRSLSEGGKEATDEEKEEKAADAHPEGCPCDDCMDKGKDEGAVEKKKEEEGDDGEIVNAEPVLSAEERPKTQIGDAVLAMDVLKSLKPFIARANDKSLNKAFDIAVNSIKKATSKGKDGKGGYGKFREAAAHLHDAAGKEEESPIQKRAKEFDAKMAEIMNNSRKRSLAGTRR